MSVLIIVTENYKLQNEYKYRLWQSTKHLATYLDCDVKMYSYFVCVFVFGFCMVLWLPNRERYGDDDVSELYERLNNFEARSPTFRKTKTNQQQKN